MENSREIIIDEKPYTVFSRKSQIRLAEDGYNARNWLIKLFNPGNTTKRKIGQIDNIAYLTMKKLVEEKRLILRKKIGKE